METQTDITRSNSAYAWYIIMITEVKLARQPSCDTIVTVLMKLIRPNSIEDSVVQWVQSLS